MAEHDQDKDTIASVVKAAKVLDCFSRSHTALSAAEIAEATGFSRAGVYRLVGTMEMLGWLRKGDNGNYRLGLKLVRLGALAGRGFDLGRELRPILEELSANLGDDSYLFVRTQGRALCVDRVVGDQPVKLTMIEVGQSLPPTQGGASLVFLAFGHPIPDVPGLDLDALRERLAKVRRDGYATNLEEMVSGVSAVSAPVLDENGIAIAAISVGGLSARYTEDHIAEVVRELKRACETARTLRLQLVGADHPGESA